MIGSLHLLAQKSKITRFFKRAVLYNKRLTNRTALHEAVVRADLDVAALLLANPGLSGLDADDLCDQDE